MLGNTSYIAIEIILKSYEIQSNRCRCALQAIMPLIGFLLEID